MADGGKGHAQRPRSVSDEEWASRYDAIFQRDLPEVKPTGYDNGLSQDYDAKLGRWFAEKPNARQEVMEAFADVIAAGTGIMQNGKRIDPESVRLPASLIEGIMSTETCGYPFCQCVDVCKEAK